MADGDPQRTEDRAKGSAARHDTSTERGRLAFIQVLNDRLPRKRLIAQGLLRDEDGRVLLCELTYKRFWDLPGGVVDPGESPATCVAREVREELGLDVSPGALLAVDWLPPWRGWDDALLCLFDLGTVPAATLDTLRLQPREIAAVHWADAAQVDEHVAAYTARLLTQVAEPGPTRYLEDSEEVG